MPAQSRITVFRGWDDLGNYVWSPFVTKAELRLRITGVTYQAASGSARVAPRGKIPYITLDGSEPVSDSTLIIYKLTEIWKAFEALLIEAKRKQGAGDAPFRVLGGESPSEADIVLFAFTASVLVCTACRPRFTEGDERTPYNYGIRAENPWLILPRLQALGLTHEEQT